MTIKKTVFFLIIFISINSCSSQENNQDQKINLDSLYPSSDIVISHHSEWTKAHYIERIKEFKANPLENGDIVFIGNSITEQGGDWGQRFNNSKIKNRGIAGDVTEGVLNRLKEIYYYQPSKIFILIGINDMFHDDLTPEIISNAIIEIVENIHRESPSTEIYLQTILPTSHEDLVEKIKTTNELIVKLHPNYCKILDIHSVFANTNDLMIDAYTIDGVHLTESGYGVWHDFINTYVNNTNKVSNTKKSQKDGVENLKEEDSLPLIPKRFLEQKSVSSGYCLVYGHSDKKTVALTFDDGPTDLTSDILYILDTHGIKATFFWLGKNVSNNSAIVNRALTDGQLIANHSWDHTNGINLSNHELWDNQVLKTFNELKKFGVQSNYFRPPFGGITNEQIQFLRSHNIKTVLWSITTLDWDDAQNNEEQMFEKFKQYLHNGSIVLMHDFDFGKSKDKLKALERMIVYGKSQGFEFVTIDNI